MLSGGLVVRVSLVLSISLSLGRSPANAREQGHWSEDSGVSHGMKREVSNLLPSVREAWKTGPRKAQDYSL